MPTPVVNNPAKAKTPAATTVPAVLAADFVNRVASIASSYGAPVLVPQGATSADVQKCSHLTTPHTRPSLTPRKPRVLRLSYDRRARWASASRAALAPHLPCAPGPGGVAAEQMYMPGTPIS